MLLRMISLNSLAAFTVESSRSLGGVQPARGPAASGPGAAAAARNAPGAGGGGAMPQRPLDMVPPAPGQALPRGSLLDLRV